MVLENSTTQSPPPSSSSSSFSDSPPTSDADHYSTDPNSTHLPTRESSYIPIYPQGTPGPSQIYVNLSTLPRPWSLFGTSPQPEILIHSIQQIGQQSSELLGRPLKQEEADALAFHRANAISIGSYGTPIGVACGWAQAWRKSSSFRFPGYTPGEKFDPNKFFRLEGPRARVMWHAVRFNAYGALGLFVGQVFFGTYAWSMLAAGQLKDARLKGFIEEVNRRGKEGIRRRTTEGDEVPGPKRGESFEMARQRQGVQRGRTTGKRREEGDDMSPTGGAFGEEYSGVGDVDMGLMTDEQIRRQQQQEQQRVSSSRGDYASESAPQPSPSNRSTAQRRASSEASSDATSDRQQSQQPGGAWARLRQQAVSGKQPRDDSSSGGSNSLDSFSFSQGEEDKQLARSEAQKQFDARIEREREGRDFDDRGGGSSSRRW